MDVENNRDIWEKIDMKSCNMNESKSLLIVNRQNFVNESFVVVEFRWILCSPIPDFSHCELIIS